MARSVDPDDRFLLEEALHEAQRALAAGEVPVGAVVLLDGRIIGRGFNRPIGATDPTAHAEIEALRDAARGAGNYRLPGATVAVTLEPCLMCYGAALHARVRRILFGAFDPRFGASALVSDLQAQPQALNHRLSVEGGILAEPCASILKEFFVARRCGRV